MRLRSGVVFLLMSTGVDATPLPAVSTYRPPPVPMTSERAYHECRPALGIPASAPQSSQRQAMRQHLNQCIAATPRR